MKTKVIDGELHFKKKRFCFFEGEIRKVRMLSGKMRVVKHNGSTYVVFPINGANNVHEGFLIPIVEDYDSL